MQPAVNALASQLNGLSLDSRCKLLSAALKRADSHSELTRLWNNQRPYFNTFNTSAILHRLQRLLSTREHGLTPAVKVVLNQVLLHAETLVSAFDTDGLRIVSNSLRHLKPENQSLFQAIKRRLFDNDRELLERLDTTSLALIVDAAVELEDDPELFLMACKDVLLDPYQPRLQACKKPEELAYIARAYSLKKSPDKDLFEALQSHILREDLIPKFMPWHLAMLADGVSACTSCCQPLLAAIMAYCEAHPAKTTAKCDGLDLGLLKSASLKLFRPSTKLLAQIRHELHSRRVVAPQDAPAYILLRMADSFSDLAPTPETLLATIKKKLFTNDAKALGALKATDLVTGLRVFANAATPDPKLIPHFIAELSKETNLHQLPAKELTRLCWGCLKLNPAPSSLMNLVTKELTKKLHELSLADLSKLAVLASQTQPVLVLLLEAIKRLLLQPEALVKECGLVELAELASVYKKRGLFQSVEVFGFIEAKLAQIDPQSFVQYDPKYFVILISALLEVKSEKFSFDDLALLAYRLVRIEQFDAALFKRISELLSQKIPQASTEDTVSLMRASWSFVKIGQPHPKITELLFRSLETKPPVGYLGYKLSEEAPVVILAPLDLDADEFQMFYEIYHAMPPEMAEAFPKLKRLIHHD